MNANKPFEIKEESLQHLQGYPKYIEMLNNEFGVNFKKKVVDMLDHRDRECIPSDVNWTSTFVIPTFTESQELMGMAQGFEEVMPGFQHIHGCICKFVQMSGTVSVYEPKDLYDLFRTKMPPDVLLAYSIPTPPASTAGVEDEDDNCSVFDGPFIPQDSHVTPESLADQHYQIFEPHFTRFVQVHTTLAILLHYKQTLSTYKNELCDLYFDHSPVVGDVELIQTEFVRNSELSGEDVSQRCQCAFINQLSNDVL
jgi:hypothetical protein